MLHSIRTSYSSHAGEFHREWRPINYAPDRSRDVVGGGRKSRHSPALVRNRGDSVHVSGSLVASVIIAGISGGRGVFPVGPFLRVGRRGVSSVGRGIGGVVVIAGKRGVWLWRDRGGAGGVAGWREECECAAGVGGGARTGGGGGGGGGEEGGAAGEVVGAGEGAGEGACGGEGEREWSVDG